MSETVTVGVDIGGTKVVVGAVGDGGELVTLQRYSTPTDVAATTVKVIAEAVAGLGAKYRVDAVGVGVAGWLDAAGELVRYAPNLGWREVPLRRLVADAVRVPVVVENDANAAAWGEYRFGAASDSGAHDMLLITVGTGLGGGVVLGGALYRGSFGMAAELGHVRVVPDGVQCGCGARGCWEQYASGRALERFAVEELQRSPERSSLLRRAAGPRPTGPEIARAALAGDEAALAAFGALGRWLGVGLADVVAAWDPTLIVIGGGVAETGKLLLEPACAAYQGMLADRNRWEPYARVVLAQLGNAAGLIGAADLARLAQQGG